MANGSVYTAGIVHFGSDPDLEENLASLRDQSLPPEKIFVVDHSGRSQDSEQLRARNGDVEWIVASNRGYASGANRVIARAEEVCPDADFVLVMNPDVRLDVGFAQAVIRAMQARPRVAIATGRLLRPGRATIDSAGIDMSRTRKFRDRGSEEPDDGRFSLTEPVFAVSGAAMMLRREVLASLAVDGEIFDEDFFVYHEDTDLAWRARNLGHLSLYVADAVAVHVRGWRSGGRRQIALNIRRHSFKNRYLELIKNDALVDFVRDLPFILAVEVARLGYAILADRSVLAGYGDAVKHARRALRKRREIQRKIEMSRSLRMRDDPTDSMSKMPRD